MKTTTHALTQDDIESKQQEQSKGDQPPFEHMRRRPVQQTLPFPGPYVGVLPDKLGDVPFLWQAAAHARARGHVGNGGGRHGVGSHAREA